jgi:hypothetical protein
VGNCVVCGTVIHISISRWPTHCHSFSSKTWAAHFYRKKFALSFWLQWVFAYTIAFVASEEIIKRYFLQDIEGEVWVWGLLTLVVGATISGFILGTLQWLVLRPHRFSIGWIVVTALGSAPVFLLEGFNFIGSAITQTFILRRHVRWSGLWIAANIPLPFMSLYLSNYFASSHLSFFIDHLKEMRLVISIVSGSLGGVLTGATLVWLLRHRKLENAAVNR